MDRNHYKASFDHQEITIIEYDFFLCHSVMKLIYYSFPSSVLQECSTNITNYSCERVESLTSLTSKDSKVSFTGSMKSRSSSTSCSSASSKGHSLQTSKSVDHEVMKIQDRLVFSSNVPVSSCLK
jgi:hypothetical protein